MKKWIVIILASLLTLLMLALGAGLWGYQQLNRFGATPLQLEAATELPLPPGTSFAKLGMLLQAKGWMTFDWRWKLLARVNPPLTMLRSGLYEVTPGDTPLSLLARIVAGDEKRFSLTLVEGRTIAEWSQYLQQLPHLTVNAAPFLAVLQAEGDDSGKPEGKFFPDTYQYRAGTEATALLTQSFQKMRSELSSIWEQRDSDLPLKSAYELLILASIIEKETAKATERPLVAAVFINRLRQGMRLQTDPTVIYGMGERFDGNITRKDLQQDTPFNTYRISGLPPTPIAAPGRESLLAAAHPAKVAYLYFVSRNDGSHVFSTTLAEHNRAVDQYQRKKNNAANSATPR